MSLVNDLTDLLAGAFEAVGIDRRHGEVVVSQRPDLAQFQCNGALPAAKAAGRNPREIAQDVVDRIADDHRLAEVSIAGPGFINLTVTDETLAAAVESVGSDGTFDSGVAESRNILVDYGGPNVAKELHVGHLRPAIIGESIKRALGFVGHAAVGDVHLGDWGLPMGQLIVQLSEELPDLPYFDEHFEGPYPDESPVTVEELNRLYPTASGRAKNDDDFAAAARQATFELQDGRPGYRALWEHFRQVSVDAMRSVYDELGVYFERWYGEASVHDRIAPMILRLREDGVAHDSEGALVVDVERPDDAKEVPPVVIVSSTGAYLYSTTDMATLEDRADDGFQDVYYFVDVRQGDHFEGVFRAARLGGIVSEDMVLDHVGTGLVNGQDGRPLKTRDGNLPLLRSLVTDAVDLAKKRMDERGLAADYPEEERAEVARMVGLAALKYGDLQNHRTSNYTFDLERFTSFEGKTGPYLLYGAVRMGSILREAEHRGIAIGEIVPPAGDADRNLMLRLLRFAEMVHRSIDHRSPNHVAEHAYEVVADFNRFYEACRILDEPDEAQRGGWLGLVDVTRRQLVALLDILAIEVPDRM